MNSLLLVQMHREAYTCLKRRGLGVELVAVEAHPRFEPQRVARPEPHGRGACFDEAPPDARRVVGRTVELEAVLARIAGARDDAA